MAKYRMKFSWPVVCVPVNTYNNEPGYFFVTMPDGAEYRLDSKTFHQSFAKEPDKECEMQSASGRTMLHNANVITAGHNTLNDRWIPMANAASIHEMMKIYDTTNCEFCKLYTIHTEFTQPRTGCKNCELNDDSVRTCCWEYGRWTYYTQRNNYESAKLAANALCRRIKEVIRDAGGDVQ